MRRGHVKSIACIVEGWARIPSGAVPHACQTMHTVSRPTAAFSTGGREIPSMRDSGFLAAASWSVVRADSQFIGPGTIVQGARRRGVLPALAGAANPRGVRGMGAISRGPSKELLPYDRAPEDGAGPSTDDSLLEKQVADGPAGDQNTVGAGQRPRNVGPVSARVLALPLPGGSAEGARTSPERMFTRFVETMRGFAPRNWTTILREVAAHSPNHARTLLRVASARVAHRESQRAAAEEALWPATRSLSGNGGGDGATQPGSREGATPSLPREGRESGRGGGDGGSGGLFVPNVVYYNVVLAALAWKEPEQVGPDLTRFDQI